MLSTDSCRLFPLRTTFTACHSLSFSFCPANSVSGPLPVVGGGIQITNSTVGKGVCAYSRTLPTPQYTHTQSSHAVCDRASGENLHVCQTHSHYGFSQYAGNERTQISGLTDCKIERLLKTLRCCSRMPSKESRTKKTEPAEEVD